MLLVRYTISEITNQWGLMKFIKVLEEKLGKKAKEEFLPMEDGNVPGTYADVDDLMRDIGFKPNTSIRGGISKFVDWYREYYKVRG